MRIRSKLLIALCAVFCASCATPMSPKAAAIQVHNQMSTLLTNCKNLGPINATVTDAVWGSDKAARDAKTQVREQAADKGGDTVVIVNTDLTATSATVQGAALRCY